MRRVPWNMDSVTSQYLNQAGATRQLVRSSIKFRSWCQSFTTITKLRIRVYVGASYAREDLSLTVLDEVHNFGLIPWKRNGLRGSWWTCRVRDELGLIELQEYEASALHHLVFSPILMRWQQYLRDVWLLLYKDDIDSRSLALRVEKAV